MLSHKFEKGGGRGHNANVHTHSLELEFDMYSSAVKLPSLSSTTVFNRFEMPSLCRHTE